MRNLKAEISVIDMDIFQEFLAIIEKYADDLPEEMKAELKKLVGE